MEIVFVRHAEKDLESKDGNLSKKGMIQANNLAKRLSKDKFHEFYCSDKTRAKETATIVSKKIGLKPIIKKSLDEFDALVFKTEYQKWDSVSKKKYKSLKVFLDSFTKRTNSNKRILIIAHGNTNRLILGILLELGLKNLIRFRQLETAINEVYWKEYFNNWRMKYWNDVYHQPKALVEGKNNY